MSRTPVIACLLLLAGCASGASSVPTARTGTRVSAVPGQGYSGTVITTTETTANVQSVSAPPEQVFAIASRVYADLGLPINLVHPGSRIVGTVEERVRRIGNKGPGTYFNCSGPYGNSANRYDVYVSVRTQVLPAAEGSTTRTEAVAVAKASTSGTWVQCSTNGALEALISKTIQEHVASAAQ